MTLELLMWIILDGEPELKGRGRWSLKPLPGTGQRLEMVGAAPTARLQLQMGFPVSPWVFFSPFLTLHLLRLGSADFRVVGPSRPLLATVGQDIVLPCQLSQRMDARSLEIRWIRHQLSETVHLYRHGEDQYGEQMKEYTGRTELARDDLSSGILDLLISGLRPSDDGQYVCTVRDGASYGEATVELEVAALGFVPLLSLEAYEDGGIRVVCRSAGWYPSPQVLWKDASGQHLPSVSQRRSPDERGFFEIQDVTVLSGKEDGKVSCVVRNSRLEQEQASSLQISAPFFHNARPWMAALGVLLLLLVICFGVIAYLFRRKVVQSRALGKRDAELEEQSALLEQRDAALEEQAVLLEQRNAELEKQAALLIWRNFLLPENPDVVVLDPNTAHPELVLSMDLRSVKRGPACQNLTDHPKRFSHWRCVLGQNWFWNGRHCWEVEVKGEVGGDSWWGVGVARDSVERKRSVDLRPEEGIWAVDRYAGQFRALTSPRTILSLSPLPRRIWVCLDCTRGLVTFLNADTGGEIFTFPPGLFHGETLRPWFLLETEETQLCLGGGTQQTFSPAFILNTNSRGACPFP